MEELNFNDASFINCFSYSNMTSDSSKNYIPYTILNYVDWVTIAIGLPLVIIVMTAVFFQVKNGQEAPVYVINLLVSDIVQFCSRISFYFVQCYEISILVSSLMTFYGLLVRIGFMVCVSCERYLVVAKPLWYRFRRNIKTYVVVCTVIWIHPVLLLLFLILTGDDKMTDIILTVLILLPFPLFIFFLVGTIKALCGAFNVSADEKRRIAAIQVVVLIIYTLLCLPIVIGLQVVYTDFWYTVGLICVSLSPLADTTLYLFSRKSFMDKILTSICYKISDNQETSNTDNEDNESRIVTVT